MSLRKMFRWYKLKSILRFFVSLTYLSFAYRLENNSFAFSKINVFHWFVHLKNNKSIIFGRQNLQWLNLFSLPGASSLLAAVLAQQQQQQQQENLESASTDGTSSSEAPIQKIKSEQPSSSMLLLQPQVSLCISFLDKRSHRSWSLEMLLETFNH